MAKREEASALYLLLDKLILLLCGLLPAIYLETALTVAAMLTALTFSALSGYFSSSFFTLTSSGVYWLLCFFFPEFHVFLPLAGYDAFRYLKWWQTSLAFLPLAAAYWGGTSAAGLLMPAVLLLFSLLLQRSACRLQHVRHEYYQLQDHSRELYLRVKNQNRELLEKQDYEVQLATLNERNRISREIHDNVGHLLSRSLLQVGALIAVEPNAEKKEGLSGVRVTLSDAMDRIRSSVHNLHDESLDLRLQLTALAREFHFCPLFFDYDASTPPEAGMVYAVLAISREALSNIARHSQATQAELLFREHPAFFQLIIRDNGRGAATDSPGGIGLHSIKERVDIFHGHLSIKNTNGFQLFITLPKGERLS